MNEEHYVFPIYPQIICSNSYNSLRFIFSEKDTPSFQAWSRILTFQKWMLLFTEFYRWPYAGTDLVLMDFSSNR